jgi:hypothetical protein
VVSLNLIVFYQAILIQKKKCIDIYWESPRPSPGLVIYRKNSQDSILLTARLLITPKSYKEKSAKEKTWIRPSTSF